MQVALDSVVGVAVNDRADVWLDVVIGAVVDAHVADAHSSVAVEK